MTSEIEPESVLTADERSPRRQRGSEREREKAGSPEKLGRDKAQSTQKKTLQEFPVVSLAFFCGHSLDASRRCNVFPIRVHPRSSAVKTLFGCYLVVMPFLATGNLRSVRRF